MLTMRHRLIPLAALAALLLAAAAHGQFSIPPAGTAKPAGKYPLLDYKLRLAFDRMDLNKDGYLDRDELAKAFRGAKAKAAPPLYDDKGQVTVGGRQAPTKYPDLMFLTALDKDGDDQISWNEYRTYWETAYANYLAAYRHGPAQAFNYAPRRNGNYYRGLGHSTSQAYRNAHRGYRGQNRSYSRGAATAQRQRQQYVSQVLNSQRTQARRYAQNLAHLQQQRQQYVQRVLAQRQQAYRRAVSNVHHAQQHRATTVHRVVYRSGRRR